MHEWRERPGRRAIESDARENTADLHRTQRRGTSLRGCAEPSPPSFNSSPGTAHHHRVISMRSRRQSLRRTIRWVADAVADALDFNPPAVAHFIFSELKPLLGLVLVPPFLIAEVLTSVYDEGGLHPELLCGMSFGQSKRCVEEYAFARVWARHPPLPTNCHLGNPHVVLQENAIEFADRVGRAGRGGRICVSAAPGVELLSTLLPATPFKFNVFGLLMLVPLFALLLSHFVRAGGMRWHAGDAAYLHFTTHLPERAWVSAAVALTAIGSLSLCVAGVAVLVSIGGPISTFLREAVPVLALQFLSLRAILDIGGSGLPIALDTNGVHFRGLKLRRGGLRLLYANRELLREFEHAALIGDAAQLDGWIESGAVSQVLALAAQCKGAQPATSTEKVNAQSSNRKPDAPRARKSPARRRPA